MAAQLAMVAGRMHTVRLVVGLFKLRIGVVIAITAVAGWAVASGPPLAGWQVAVMALAVLLSSASAGAFNQYVERDIDARMKRTRKRAKYFRRSVCRWIL